MTRTHFTGLDVVRHPLRQAILLGILGMAANAAQAFTFETESGWQGSLDTTLSVGSSWRAEGRDNALYSAADGLVVGKNDGQAGTAIDSGNLNYDRGDRFSTIGKVLSELSLRKGDFGGLVRVKGWYDQALEDENVDFGNQANGFKSGKPLSDKGFEDLQKNKGVYLLDAYVYDTYYLNDQALQLRLGRQVVNWGESIFIQGVNQINPLDVPSFRRPGTEIKEALLPLWMLHANFSLSDGLSLEAFYQFKWEPTVVEGCGNYWSTTENLISTHPGGCDMATSLTDTVGEHAIGLYPRLSKGRDARDSGQWGLALRYLVESIDTEVGLYAMNLHSRTPILSARNGIGAAGVTGLANPVVLDELLAGVTATSGFYEYPEDIRLYGLSAATTLAGWSMGAELSYSPNTPVQRNGNDIITGLLLNQGPVTGDVLAAGQGGYVAGYDRFEKTQLQVNGINIFPNVLGASQLMVIGEVVLQWGDVPDSADGVRYGRAPVFGSGTHAEMFGGIDACNGINPNPTGCKNDGYVTDFAWGYRLRAQLEYADPFAVGVTTTPSLFFGHDVEGYSLDGQFNEGRMTVGAGVRFDYQKAHSLDFNYVTYSNDADYDPLRDRDHYSMNYSYKF
ncbi:DUF1302 domain-containing protein [Stutzerimonas chloritidismutans]|uniref:DUF1302 domain-containing protein n=1 Tax=Stutzerimonas chloritidismutans TaxID=203192 RepID=UPI00041B7A72|nr:DUF1302 domain-containing protein [Stutzerimonas chloritidismutans]